MLGELLAGLFGEAFGENELFWRKFARNRISRRKQAWRVALKVENHGDHGKYDDQQAGSLTEALEAVEIAEIAVISISRLFCHACGEKEVCRTKFGEELLLIGVKL